MSVALRPLRAALLLASLAAAAPLAAQHGATLSTTVTDSATGQPLASVRVQVRGTRAAGLTAQDGTVTLAGIPNGTHEVQVSLVGYEARTQSAMFQAGLTTGVAFALGVQPVELEGVEAEARTWGRRYLEAHGFYQRKRSVPGAFITRDELVHDQPRSLSFVLSRFSRMSVRNDVFSSTASARTSGNYGGQGECTPNYFVNGLLVVDFDVTSIPVETIEGIEVYSGASEVPPQYNRDHRGACGAVVIWTRVH